MRVQNSSFIQSVSEIFIELAVHQALCYVGKQDTVSALKEFRLLVEGYEKVGNYDFSE